MSSLTRRSPRIWILTNAFCAMVTGAAIAVGVWRHPGVPAYLQDWQWPAYGELLRSFVASKLSSWDWSALGQPNLGMQVHPYYFLLGLLSFVLSTKLILLIVLAAATAIGAVAVAACVHDLGGQPAPSLAAAVMYSLAPFTINELVAGHIEILVGVMALPIAVWAGLRVSLLRSWVLAFALAWSALHIQFVLIVLISVVVLCGIRPLIMCSWRLLFPLCAMLPQLWALLRPSAMLREHSMLTTVPWLSVQSQPLQSAVTGAHYFAGYWDHVAAASPFVHASQWIYPASIIAVILLRKMAVRIALLFAISVLLVAGTQGPLGAAMSLLAAHLSFFSAFRELYHFAIMIPLASALAAGVALSAIPSAPRTALAVAAAAVLTLPFFTGAVLEQVASVFGSSGELDLLRMAATAPVPARIFLAPGFSPVGPADRTSGGADPLAFGLGNEIPLWSYRPMGEMPNLIWHVYQTKNLSLTFLSRFGIDGLFVRHRLESRLAPSIPYAGAPPIRTFGEIAPKADFTASRTATAVLYRMQRSHPLLYTSSSFTPAGRRLSTVFALVHGGNPNTDWVPGEDWWFINPLVAQYSQTDALTWSKNATLSLSCEKNPFEAVFITLYEFDSSSNQSSPPSEIVMGCVSRPRLKVSSRPHHYFVAIANEAVQKRESTDGAPTLNNSLGHFSFTATRITAIAIRQCIRCALNLSAGFDPGWQARVNGADFGPPSTSSASGMGMSWFVSMHPGAHVEVEYAPQRKAFVLEVLSLISWSVILVALLYRALVRG